MTEATGARPLSRCGLVALLQRFRPTWDHLAAANREVLLAAKSVLEIQIGMLDDWRARHTRPRPTEPEKVG